MLSFICGMVVQTRSFEILATGQLICYLYNVFLLLQDLDDHLQVCEHMRCPHQKYGYVKLTYNEYEKHKCKECEK